jgi:hypothetical protein
MEGSPKVKRRKIDIQEFDCDIKHIPGEQNIVADCTSRLCASAKHQLMMLAPKQVQIPKDKYKIMSKVHNSVVGHLGYKPIMQKLHLAQYG